MSRAVRLLAVLGLGVAAAGLLEVLEPATNLPVLAILAAAIVSGELLELRPVDRHALPLSFAYAVVLLRAATPQQFVMVICLSFLVAVAVREQPKTGVRRAVLYVDRVAAALAAGAVYGLVLDLTESANHRAAVIGALAAAALVEVGLHDFIASARARSFSVGHGPGAGADIALVTTSILMAVGYKGIDGEGELGLWAVALFTVLLIAAWYSFELLDSTRRNFKQTVRALGATPELGGLVRAGHTERVAELAVAIGKDLDLSSSELDDLETAALLHHLGAVCLDEYPEDGSVDAAAVAAAGAQMLRASEALAQAGDIVAAETSLHRPSSARNRRSPAALPGQILKVASAFDELTEGDPQHAAWAVEALFTGPSYVYDGRVLDALERVVVRSGLVAV